MLRIGVYPLLLAGWSSGRKYSSIGAFRGVAQTISYEIRLALIFIRLLILVKTCDLYQAGRALLFCMPALLTLWLISAVAETNRTPFDFAEGESELVSGFNIEYASKLFALVFMAEYGMIIIFSFLTVRLFTGFQAFGAGSLIFGLGVIFF